MVKYLTKNLAKFFDRPKIYVIIIPLILTVFVFRKYIFNGLLPIPADIFPGLYFPWFDYKWGYFTPVPVQNAAISDVVSILYPWRIMAFRYLKQGILPLWDPTILLGSPLLANFQTALFNPFNFFFLFIREYHAWSLGIIIQPLLITYTTFLFLRNLKISAIPSLFGALLFSYSNYSIVWMEYNSINFTIAYFPLMLLSVSKLSQNTEWKWFLILSLSLCLSIFSGYPQNVIYSILISILYFIYLLKGQNNQLKKLLFFAMSVILGILLSSVQLIPSFELYNLSIRNLDKVALAGDVKYLPLRNLITILFPDYFGNPGRWNYWGSGSYDNFAFTIASVGVYFAVISLFYAKRYSRDLKFFLLLIVIIFMFAIKNPISEGISNIGVLGFISASNSRILFAVSLALSILAAKGLMLSLDKKLKKINLLIPLLIFGIFSIIHLIWLLRIEGGDLLHIPDMILKRADTPSVLSTNLIISIRNMILPTITILAITFVLFFKNKKIIIYTVFIFLFINVITSTDKYLSFVKKELLYPNTEVTDFLKENTLYSRFEKENNNLVFPSNSWSLYGLSSPSGQDSLTLLSTSRYLSLINYGNINDEIATRYNSIINLNSPLFNTLNVSYYSAINWLNDSPDIRGKPNMWLLPNTFEEVKNIKTIRLYKNTSNIGLAWFPQNIICEKNDNNIFKAISSDGYDPVNVIYVNCDGRGLKGDTQESVLLDKMGVNSILFSTNTNTDNFLIVSSAFYPGWMYKIDGGKTQNINKADTALIAVKIPKGNHRVEIIYKPTSFIIGLSVTVASLFVFLFIYFIKIRKVNRNIFLNI